MKLFYFVDFEFIKRYGVPITYDKYIHLERGPIPSNILNLVNSVIDEGDDAILSDTIQIDTDSKSSLQKIQCLEPFSENDKNIFSEKELEILEFITNRYRTKGAWELVNISHKQAPWLKTNELDEIPYYLAAQDDDCLVEEQDIKLLSQI